MNHLALIGKKLNHSFSKKYFEEKFRREQIAGWDYKLIEMEDLSTIRQLAAKFPLTGFNVTIPFKEVIIPWCDLLSANASEIGAVNCVSIINGIWTGHNTDAPAFTECIRPYLNEFVHRAVILGSGGAARAVRFALEQAGVASLFVSRHTGDLAYHSLNKELLDETGFIINCTPLGTFPDVGLVPEIPFDLITEKHLCIDLVYNPPETQFLKLCAARGAKTLNGQSMLELQAELSWKIWNKYP